MTISYKKHTEMIEMYETDIMQLKEVLVAQKKLIKELRDDRIEKTNMITAMARSLADSTEVSNTIGFLKHRFKYIIKNPKKSFKHIMGVDC